MSNQQWTNAQIEARDTASDFENRYRTEQGNAAIEYFDSVASQEQADVSLGQRVSEMAGDVAKDVSIGFSQAHRSVARGATKAVNQLIEFAGYVADLAPTVTMLNAEGQVSIPRVVTTGEQERRQARRAGVKPPETPQLPVPEEPAKPTVTGSLIEGISQFVVGFGAVGRAAGALSKASGVVGTAARAVQSNTVAGTVAKGTIAEMLAFDAHEQRLSNVIQQVPSLQNPLTQYLAADPEDGQAEAMFKQAVEGAVTGLAGEALFRGIRAFRNGRNAVNSAAQAGLSPDDIADRIASPTRNVLGDENSTEMLIKRRITRPAPELTPEQVAAGAQRVPEETDQIAINFARIQGPDDVKNLMQSMANDPKMLADVQAARRGVVSDASLAAAAGQEDAFSVLMSRRVGQALNDQQTLAARELYAQTTDRLLEAAKAAHMGGSEDVFAFRRMLAVHSAVQSEVLGARAEAARALRAWSLPVGSTGSSRVRAVEDLLKQYGGVDASNDLAKRLTAAAESGMLTAEGINKIANGGALARSTRALQELWSMGLLTSPRTHLVNIGSNVLNGLYLGTERLAMSAVPDSGVKPNEAFGYFVGYIGSFREALRNGANALRTGQSQFMAERLEQPMVRATAKEVLDPNGKLGFVSKAVDALGYFYQRTVGAGLAAGDDFGRTLLYNAELRARAIRDANRLGLTGADFDNHVHKLINQPTDLAKSEALDFARYGVFMEPLGRAGQAVQAARAEIPALGFVVPFVQTPANIFKFTFARTPLGLLSQQIRDDIAAGGAKGAARIAGISMGTTVMMMGTDMALNGEITGAGPSDPNTRRVLRDSGWQPYSIKVGDRYISYQKIQPLGTWLALSANMTEILGNYENYDIAAQQEIDKLAVAMVASISEVVLSASFMTGAAELTEMLADPERYGPQWANRYAGSIVPNIVADLEKAISPEIEEVFNMQDAIRARIPGMSGSVYKKRNVYGEEISAYYPQENSRFMRVVEGAGRVFNPLQFSDDDRPSNELSQYFMVNGMRGVTMPNKVQNFPLGGFGMAGSVPIDLRQYPQIWDRFMQLRGELVLDGFNATLKDYLLDAVSGNNDASIMFEDQLATVDDKDNMVTNIVSKYDDAIREQLLNEFPVLQQAISDEAVRMSSMQQPDTSQGLVRTRPFP